MNLEIEVTVTVNQQHSWASNEVGRAEMKITLPSDMPTLEIPGTLQSLLHTAMNDYNEKQWEIEREEAAAKLAAEIESNNAKLEAEQKAATVAPAQESTGNG